jgi:hypothetical protein
MNLPLPHTIKNVAGEKLTFLRIYTKEGKEFLDVENEVQPNAGPPMHVHYKTRRMHYCGIRQNRLPGAG